MVHQGKPSVFGATAQCFLLQGYFSESVLCQILNIAAGDSSTEGFRNIQEGGRWEKKICSFASHCSGTFCFAKPQLSSQLQGT